MKNEGFYYGIYGALTVRTPIKKEESLYGDQKDQGGASFLRVEVTGNWAEVDYSSEGTGTAGGVDDYVIEA
ncbi:MAG: hypothetical protein U9N86_12155, partial [Bacteroidota bacterium]|nr:hypothetical protein [Bacteroidota bacterium]